MLNPKKIKIVEQLSEKLRKSKGVVLTNYQGLTHKQLEALRKKLNNVKSSITVAKNRLLKIALHRSGYIDKPEDIYLEGPTAVVIMDEEEIGCLRELYNFVCEFKLPVVKGGFLFGKYVEAQRINELSQMPSRNALLAQITYQFKSPLYRLHRALALNLNRVVWVLNEVKKTKK